jgi:uncharacterized membrane protein
MSRRLAWLSTALVLLAGAGYQFLLHAAVTGELPETARLGVRLLPLLALAAWAALRARRKAPWFCALLATAGALWWLDRQPAESVLAYGLPHAAVYLFLLGFFARTLAAGRTPLVTQLALRVHGTLPPRIVAYTRAVTIAWCLFFAAQVLASALLYLFASRSLWAWYITALHFPLVILMFVLEYAVRRWRFPDHPTTSVLRTMQVFSEHTSAPPGAAPSARAAPASARTLA